MRLKTYFAPSMNEAMMAIRRDLGGDALIISTLEEKDGVRVTAAVDEKNQPAEISPPALKRTPDETLAQLGKCLAHHGLGEDLQDDILHQAASLSFETLEKGLEATLGALFRYAPLQPHAAPSLLMLVGLPGAGKSVTTAKIAAEFLLAGKKVEIITLDVHKAGAFEQLSSYASIMNTPLHAARAVEELIPHLEKTDQNVQLLIDTPGVNPFDKKDMSFLSQCILQTRQAPSWVMPAGADVLESLDIASAFKDLGVTNLFLTRSESARRHGALLAVLSQSGLRLSAMSQGPTVGSRLVKASEKTLHDLLGGDRFFEPKEEHAPQRNKKIDEPEWLIKLREARA